jgi:SlyX protein
VYPVAHDSTFAARIATVPEGMYMSEERFIDLETRLTHQDQLLNELNDVVTAQQGKIMELEELCKALIQRVRSVGDGAPGGDAADERPPHY